MSGIARSALRLKSLVGAPAKFNSSRIVSNVQGNRAFFSTIQQKIPLGSSSSFAGLNKTHRNPCACVSCRSFSCKAEKDLVEFLSDEIDSERKSLKVQTIPSKFEGFDVKLDGAQVTLTKVDGEEQIKIYFNVNHTVDDTPSQNADDFDPRSDQPEIGEMESKPDFNVEIKKGKQILAFTCSYNPYEGDNYTDNEMQSDTYGIEEISLYEGERTEKTYAVAGQIVDGYLYDLLMNYLEEKGVSCEFAEKLVKFSSNYEHTAYIGLLESLKKFTEK